MAKKVILKDDNVEIMPITRGELVLDSSGQLAFHSSQFLATQSLPGLMSGEDKTKLDSLEKVTVEDKKVEQVNTTTNNSYRILFSNSADDTTKTEGTRKSAKLLFNPSTGALTATALIGKLDWSNLNEVPEAFTPAQHIHNTSEITALTSYSKASSASDLVTTDTLNVALGKLEYKADAAYDFYKSVTGTDNDEIINKWEEIVDFIDSVKEGSDITDMFVTRETDQTITGVKTFALCITIQSGLDTKLVLNNTDTESKYQFISFRQDGTQYGYLGTLGDNDLKWTGQTVLHSGNSAITGDGGSTWGSSITVKINGVSKTLTIPSNPNTHWTTRIYAGASGTAANAAATNPYLKITDDNTYRNLVRFVGGGATTVSSDASGNITISSTNTTYDLGITDYTVKISGTTKNFVRDWGHGATDMNNVAIAGRSSMGMASLTTPSGSTASHVNPNGATDWHHFINIAYTDGGGGSNSWITQIANKAGTTDLWVRSRSGGTISNTSAWAAGWTRILTGTNYTNLINTTNFPGLNKTGTVTSVTVTGANGLSGSGTVTSSGTITLSNAGVRSVTINGDYLRVNTNGTNNDLTIPYATKAGGLHYGSFDTASQITTSYAQWTNNSGCSDVASMGYAAVLNVGYGNYRWWQIWNNRHDHQLYWRPEKTDASGWAGVHILIDSANYTSYTVTKTGGGASGTWGINISGNAATAGSVAWGNITGKPSSFTPSSHNHSKITSLGNKKVADLSSTYGEGLTVAGIYNNGWPFTYGSIITANGNGGYFLIAGEWTGNITSASDNNYKTEMYLRHRRDSYDVWSTWSRVITDRNYTSYCAPASHSHSYYPLSGNTNMSGDNVWIGSTMGGGTDYWRIGGTGTSDNGVCLLTIGDNSNDYFQIIISDYTGTNYTALLVKNGGTYAPHFYENSDQRLKENIQAILNKDNIPQIKEFDWKESGEHSYGLIAQELEEQGYSELVSTKDDGYKTVNYSAALSLIVGKLQVKIKELEKEIEILKNKN